MPEIFRAELELEYAILKNNGLRSADHGGVGVGQRKTVEPPPAGRK